MPKAAVAELPLEIAVAEEHGRSVSAEERASYVARYRSGPTDAAAARFESLPATTVAALSEPFPVTQEMIDQYDRDGFLHVRGVLPPELVEVLGDSIRLHTMALNPLKGIALEERNTYNRAFIQVGGMWRHGGLAERFSFSARLAQIAAELMQTEGTLLHHDQALFKEPQGGYTPWHCDQQYWPLEKESEREAVSCWIPLQKTTADMGPMMFAKASHKLRDVHPEFYSMPISAESEANIWEYVENEGFEAVCEPFELGDVSFHSGWCLHRTDDNVTERSRDAHTMQYVGSRMQWNQGFQGGKLGAGHAMDFLAPPGEGSSLRLAGVPEVFRRVSKPRL